MYDVEVPNWTFLIKAEAKNLIDLNPILSSVEVGIYTEDGKTPAKVNEHPVVFSNNTIHTFSRAELYLNGNPISHTNNCTLHSAFIETKLMIDRGKKTWAKCQGSIYLAQTKEQDQALNKLYAGFGCKKECTAELYGALHIDFLECEKFFWDPE